MQATSLSVIPPGGGGVRDYASVLGGSLDAPIQELTAQTDTRGWSGDMLLLQTGALLRAQGALVEDDEIERVVGAIATDTPNYDSELQNLKTRD